MAGRTPKLDLTDAKRRYEAGQSAEVIADFYGVSLGHVQNAVRLGNWQFGSTVPLEGQNETLPELTLRALRKCVLSYVNDKTADADLRMITPLIKLMRELAEQIQGGKDANQSVSTYQRIYDLHSSDALAARNFASKPIVPLAGGDTGAAQWEDDDSD